jgi:hypothetical protein
MYSLKKRWKCVVGGGGDRYVFSGTVASQSGELRATPTLKVVRRVSCETYFFICGAECCGLRSDAVEAKLQAAK